jgi:hypothetical protein
MAPVMAQQIKTSTAKLASKRPAHQLWALHRMRADQRGSAESAYFRMGDEQFRLVLFPMALAVL